jgi:hypothetical protein
MQLNGFDNFILKIPNTATNVFTEKDKEDLGAWFYILTIANYIFPLISMIVALILRKKKGSDLLGFLANQGLWMFILCLLGIIPVIGTAIVLFLAVIVIYGNLTGKFFDLPLVGKIKLIKF